MVQRIGRGAAVAVFALAVVSGGCRREDQRSPVSVIGSTSIQPFAELLAQEYEKKYPDRKVDVQGGGSTAGLQAVASGLADIGMCSRELSPEEAGEFTAVAIARDGLAIVVNRENPVGSLSVEQIRGIFSGRIRRWQEVGGTDEPIRVITREESSGTRDCFVHLVMRDEKISREALVQESSGAVKELIQGNPGAIGYISLGLVGKELKAVLVDGVEPTPEKVLEGRYKLVRPLLFVTKGPAAPKAKDFIDFVLRPESQQALEAEGLIRAR